jgi:hypothetical protein
MCNPDSDDFYSVILKKGTPVETGVENQHENI